MFSEGAIIGTCEQLMHPSTKGIPSFSKNDCWISCSSRFEKVINSFASNHSESDTSAKHLITDAWGILLEVATTFWKEPVARNLSKTSSRVNNGIEWDLVEYRRRKSTIFSCRCRNVALVILYLLINYLYTIIMYAHNFLITSRYYG